MLKNKKILHFYSCFILTLVCILLPFLELHLGCSGCDSSSSGGSTPNNVNTCVGLVNANNSPYPTTLMTQCCDPGSDNSYTNLLPAVQTNTALYQTCCASSTQCSSNVAPLVQAATSARAADQANTAAGQLSSSSTSAAATAALAPTSSPVAAAALSSAATAGTTTTANTPALTTSTGNSTNSNPTLPSINLSGQAGGAAGSNFSAATGAGSLDPTTNHDKNALAGIAAALQAATPEVSQALMSGGGGKGGATALSFAGPSRLTFGFQDPAGTTTSTVAFGDAAQQGSGENLAIDDPVDYFTRINLEDSIFKIVHKRYMTVVGRWNQPSSAPTQKTAAPSPNPKTSPNPSVSTTPDPSPSPAPDPNPSVNTTDPKQAEGFKA